MATPIVWKACLGRNGWDHPLAIPDDMGAEATNVVFLDSGVAQRRPGSANVTVTVAAGLWAGIGSFAKYVPQTGLANANLLVITTDSPARILQAPASTLPLVFTLLTLPHAPDTPTQVSFVQMHGKVFLAYSSGGWQRLQVWDPTNAAGRITDVGLVQALQPTAGDIGVGTYPAVSRWYAIQERTKVGALYLRVSELGTPRQAIPSGIGNGMSVILSGVQNAETTHVVVWGSADSSNGPYYQLSGDVAIAGILPGSVYSDFVLPANYNLGTAAPLVGTNFPFPNVKYLATDGTRLLGFSAQVLVDLATLVPMRSGRVYYTPVLDATGRGDDERCENTINTSGWVDLTPGGAGSEDRGLSGPLNGEFYAFQAKGIYRLTPTNIAQAPFARHQLTALHGSVSHWSQVMAENEFGAQCIYFLNPDDGPRRIGFGGAMQWLGRDVYDLWALFNQDATTVKAWGLYDSFHKRILWWISTGAHNTPNLVLMYDIMKGRTTGEIVRYGWAQWTGDFATLQAGIMFPQGTSNLEVPYGTPIGTALVYRQPVPSVANDNGVGYTAFVLSRAYDFDVTMTRRKRLLEAYVSGPVGTAALQQVVQKNWAAETIQENFTLTQQTVEFRQKTRIAGTDISDLVVFQVQLGDQPAANATNPIWTIDRWAGMVDDLDAP